MRVPWSQQPCLECPMGVQTCAEPFLPTSPAVLPALPGDFTVPCAAAAALAERWRQAFCLCALINVGLTFVTLINLKRSAQCGPHGAQRKAMSCREPGAGCSPVVPTAAPAQCQRAASATTRASHATCVGCGHSLALLPTANILLPVGWSCSNRSWLSPRCALPCWPPLPGCSHLQTESLSLFWGVKRNASVSSSHSHPIPSPVHGQGW